jgi:rhodanese-related sulfurtransferase
MAVNEEYQKIRVRKLSPQKFKKFVEEKHPYILDVRPLRFERDASFIKGSRHCPLVFLADNYQEIPKGADIVITDWAMKQSITAAKFLIHKGFPIKAVLKGGMERWKDIDYPVEQRTPADKIESLN